jgi:hypothetical protein
MACLAVLQSSRFESEVCKCKCGRDVTEAWILGTQYCTTVPTVLECPRCTVTLAMAMTLRLLQQIVAVSCCTMYLEFFGFLFLEAALTLCCVLRRFERRRRRRRLE